MNEENIESDLDKTELIAEVKKRVPSSLMITSVKNISTSEFGSAPAKKPKLKLKLTEHPKELRRFLFGDLRHEVSISYQTHRKNSSIKVLKRKDFFGSDVKHRFKSRPGKIFWPTWQHGDDFEKDLNPHNSTSSVDVQNVCVRSDLFHSEAEENISNDVEEKCQNAQNAQNCASNV